MVENGGLRGMFGPKRDSLTGEWRQLHNEELNDLYCSPNIVRVIKSRVRWARHVACMGRGEAYRGFWWGNMRERDHLDDPGVDEIDLQEVGYESMDWIKLVQDRNSLRALVNAVMNLRVP